MMETNDDPAALVVALTSWAFHQLGIAARRTGRSIEDEAAYRLEHSLQNRRSSDRMDEFLRAAVTPSPRSVGDIDAE